MGLANKINYRVRELRGRVKRVTGRVTGDPTREAEGIAQQALGRLGRADELLKDAFRIRRRAGRRRPARFGE